VFSPDSRRVAYSAEMGEKCLVVVDGQAGPEYDDILEGSPVFSPDSSRVAYSARKGQKRFVVVDGQAGPEYDAIVRFDPAKLTFDADGALEYLASKDQTLYRVRHAASPPR